MALKVTPVELWSAKIEDRAGGAAAVLGPLAAANVNLDFALARRTPEDPGRGIVFVTPIRGAAAEQAAGAAGLSRATNIAGLRVEGENRPGTGAALARAIAAEGVSFRGLSASVFGKSYVCLFAFDSAADADRAAAAIRAMAPASKPKAKKKAAKRKRRR